MKTKNPNASVTPASYRSRRADARHTPDAAHLWKQLEDILVPRLRLTVIERAVYSHLVRHSRLEGRHRLRFSIAWLARGTRLSATPARFAVRRLAEKGILRIVERSKAGHVVEVLLPAEVRLGPRVPLDPSATNIETADFFLSRELRQAIYLRDGGRCFYCLRALPRRLQTLDHVVPRAVHGRNGYRNLVSCCVECNSEKGERLGEDFLRHLFRHGRLSTTELSNRLRALHAVTRGRRKPVLAPPPNPLPRKGRRRLNPAA